jgi:hypothetical protein
MALFANTIDLTLRQDEKTTTKLASVNFIASSSVSEALALSGHLALSAPSQIMGKFQFLKVKCFVQIQLSEPTLTQISIL